MDSDISAVSRFSVSKRTHKDLNEVELRRNIEEHMENQRLRAEFGDIMDL